MCQHCIDQQSHFCLLTYQSRECRAKYGASQCNGPAHLSKLFDYTHIMSWHVCHAASMLLVIVLACDALWYTLMHFVNTLHVQAALPCTYVTRRCMNVQVLHGVLAG